MRCSECETGEYIGSVTIDAQYDASFESCAGRYKEARDRCSRAYGYEKSEIGMRWEYWISGTKYSNHWPNGCTY